MSKSYVFDIAPGNSFIEAMLGRGHDVFLLDWGIPDELESRNTLETYSDDYIPNAVQEVLRVTGADDVNVLGYCFGAVLSLLYAVGHPDQRRRGIATSLARHAVVAAATAGIEQLFVNVIATEEGATAMFRALGSTPRACSAMMSAAPTARFTTCWSCPTSSTR